MGSGNAVNRKKHDAPIIREPKTTVTAGSLPAAGTSRQDLIAEQCDISFQVRIKEFPFTKKGIPIELDKKDKLYCVTVLGTQVALLTPGRSAMIETCLRLGVRYTGEIVTDNHKLYARFIRIIR